MKSLIALTCIAGSVFLGLSPSFAASAPKTIPIKFHIDDSGWLLTPQSCSAADEGVCRFYIDGKANMTGDLAGFDHIHGWGWVDPATGTGKFDVWEDFWTGSVKGCGNGRMMWHGTGGAGAEDQDLTTLKLRLRGKWRFVEDSGTGGLAGITSGTFTSTAEFTPGTFENHEDAVGSVRCSPAR
jgi:hypothetical protein